MMIFNPGSIDARPVNNVCHLMNNSLFQINKASSLKAFIYFLLVHCLVEVFIEKTDRSCVMFDTIMFMFDIMFMSKRVKKMLNRFI